MTRINSRAAAAITADPPRQLLASGFHNALEHKAVISQRALHMFASSSRSRLTDRDLGRFANGTLFHRVARAVCHAGCLPRKELFEAWEVARRVRRLFRGGRVLDLGGGHGLLAQMMLLLDDSSPNALVVDPALPASSGRVHEALVRVWPRLSGRIGFVRSSLADIEVLQTDVVVSCHACGALTDRVLERAAAARMRVAVLPCCHDLAIGDTGSLTGWVDGALAIDIVRATRLAQQNYRVWTQSIPADITPKNRLLVGEPAASSPLRGLRSVRSDRKVAL